MGALRLPNVSGSSLRASLSNILASGRCDSVNIGRSIPKKNVLEAFVTPVGVLGDEQSAPYIAVWGGHAGFDKAVMLWSSEVMATVNQHGASFFPGASGEQLTISGVDWKKMKTGVRIQVGDQLLLEVTYLKGPCKNLDRFFAAPKDKVQIDPKKSPDSARVLAKVLRPGRVSRGDHVQVFQHPEGPQALRIQA